MGSRVVWRQAACPTAGFSVSGVTRPRTGAPSTCWISSGRPGDGLEADVGLSRISLEIPSLKPPWRSFCRFPACRDVRLATGPLTHGGNPDPEHDFGKSGVDAQVFQRACEAIFSRFHCFDAVSASCSQFNASPSRTSRARGLSVRAAACRQFMARWPHYLTCSPLFGRTGAFHRVVFADLSRSRHGELTLSA